MRDPITRDDLRPLDYGEFGLILRTLATRVSEHIRATGTAFDAIAPILRSGAITGMHLASALRLTNILPLQYKHRGDAVERLMQPPAAKPGIATILLADSNTVTGAVATAAAADLRRQYPLAHIVLATAVLDMSVGAIHGVDSIIYALLSNEARAISTAAAQSNHVGPEVYIFPWEDVDEQWAEISECGEG